ncbi:MAG: PAS domain S-box protein [Desulfobacterales bacterium]|nr:MAG: PAS domain S-box protein [Desulfobacterales bacterium]
MKFKLNNTIILPIIALFLCVSASIAIIAYNVNVRSLERIQTEKENEKSESIRFTINAIIENHVKALQALAKTLQENKELSESLAYFSASGYSNPVNDVVTGLFPTLNVDLLLITDLEGNVVKTDTANTEGYYAVPGVQEALNGRLSIKAEDGPEGWAIRAIAPIYWPLLADLHGTVIVGIKIGDKFANQIADSVGAHLSFSHGDGNLLASSATKDYSELIDSNSILQSVKTGQSIYHHADFLPISTIYSRLKIADKTFCLIIQQDISKSFEQLQKERRNLWWMLLTIVGLVLACVFWLIYFVVRPLRSLETKTQIMINDFSGTYTYTGHGNEIDRLTKSFDFMMATLNESVDALRKSEEKYRTILDSVEAGYYELDLAGNVVWCTEISAKILGMTTKKIIGKNYEDFCEKENARSLRKSYKKVLDTGKAATELEWVIDNPNGYSISVEASAALMINEKDIPIGFRGIIRDITERKKAEEALKNSRRRLEEIIDFLPDPTWVVNNLGRVVAWNRATEKLTGIKANNILGKGDYEYSIPFYGERRPILIDLVQNWDDRYKNKYTSLKKSGDDLISEEVFIPRLGESGIYLASSARALYDSDGNPAGAIETVRDISESKKAEAALREEQGKVEKAYRLLSKYVAPQLVDTISDGEIDQIWKHNRKKLTLFFSDIKDFTSITDTLEPEDMAKVLNEYLTEMNTIINKYRGTLAQVIGDGLYVIFGAPKSTSDRDHAIRCVKMAIDMQRKMSALNKRWFKQGIDEVLQIRCGINTGMATVGGYGSSERKEYTAMGMQTNIAARLEQTCTPGGIFISHTTWALVSDDISCSEHGKINVKGLNRLIRAYSVDALSDKNLIQKE